MTQQQPDCHLLIVETALRQLPALEIGRHRRVKIDTAVLDKRHNPDRGHPFAQRGGLETGVPVNGLARGCVILADQLPVFDQGECEIAGMDALDLVHHRLHKRLRIPDGRDGGAAPARERGGEDKNGPGSQSRYSGKNKKTISKHENLTLRDHAPSQARFDW